MNSTPMFARMAAQLVRCGYSPVPLRSDNGLPLMKGWNRLREVTLSLETIAKLAWQRSDLGIGIVGGYQGLVPIDVDTDDPDVIDAVLRVLPAPIVARQGSKGFVAFYQGVGSAIVGKKFCRPDGSPLVELLGRNVVTIPPSLHRRTGLPYAWLLKATLLDTPVHCLPCLTPHHVARLGQALQRWCPSREYAPRPVYATTAADHRQQAYARAVLRGEVQRLAKLSEGRNWPLYQAASKLGKYVHHNQLSEAEVMNALMDASKRNGYCRDHSVAKAQATIRSGFRKASGDQLPPMVNRSLHRQSEARP